MAELDGWPPIAVERFDGERAEDYRRRSTRIIEIVTGFRMGHYDRESGEVMEQKLMELQDPALAYEFEH